MADLNNLEAAETVKIVGSSSTGAETNAVNATAAGELFVADLLQATGVEAALTVGTSAVEVKVGGSPLTDRKIVTVYNNSVAIIYWGRTSGVTTSSGTPIIPGRLMVFEGFSATKPIYLIGPSANLNTRITES